MRRSGVLLPIFSLPSKYGIGTFSKEAYEFVDILKAAGQSYWQILPLGPTGYGDSPYQSFSTFAGNPYFIDLEVFIEKGWLTAEECEAAKMEVHPNYIEYDKIYSHRYELLRKAFDRSDVTEDPSFVAFCKENEFWLEDYALYRELKDFFGGACWNEWEDEYRFRTKKALRAFAKKDAKGLMFQRFMQYEFWVQWQELKAYANENGVQIIGDIPIYVAFDGSDSWANPELFQFDKDGKPVAVAGCPPDAFSETGQLWGNPLYDWSYHKKTGYEWWIKRIRHCKQLYDVIRIDHFRGFDEYWAVPYGDDTAEDGAWEKGPGIELFRTIEDNVENLQIIAEDLGFLTETVLELLEESGYPGMKVLEFAFGSGEPSAYLPFNHVKNSVCYTGTHDNETLMGWYRALSHEDRQSVWDYIGRECSEGEAVWEIIRMAYGSVADTCIVPIQDYLCFGNDARINQPSTTGNNWKWRLSKGTISEELVRSMRKLAVVYGRIPVDTENSEEKEEETAC